MSQMPMQQPPMEQPMLVDLTIHKDVVTRDVRLDPVPSERVIISSDAQDVEGAKFIAYWSEKTASDLRKEGYDQDLIDELPQLEEDDEMLETTIGREVNDNYGADHNHESRTSRRYKVYEAWFDCDINGDEIDEKVKVTYVGDAETCTILKYEEWPLYRAPLFAASSVPMPHQAVGLCVADLVSDMQDLRTEMMRQYLDNLALTNQGELVVNEGMSGEVEYDSLLARGVGAVHRIKGDATITPIQVTTSMGEAQQGLTMTESLIEKRTGVSSRTQSIQADVLQNTATGASIMEEAINQRLELIARVYAEMFFKPLGRYLLHLLHRYQNKELQMRVKGRFLTFDPRHLDPDMDISVAVGLGSGNRSKLLQTYQSILQIQQQFLMQLGAASPVKLHHVIYTCWKMAEASGLEAPERFFGSEQEAMMAEQMMAQSQGNNADAQNDKAKIALEQQKAFGKLQIEQTRAKAEIERKRFETAAKLRQSQQQMEGKFALKAIEMQSEKELDQARALAGDRSNGVTDVRGVRI